MPLEFTTRVVRSLAFPLAVLAAFASVTVTAIRAEDPPPVEELSAPGVEELPPSLDDIFSAPDIGGNLLSEPDPQVFATLTLAAADHVTLSVRLELPEGGNTYSQDPSFSKPTKFEIREAVGLAPVDPAFTPSTPPKRGYDENLRKEVEKHYGTVTWTRTYRLLSGVSLADATVSGKIEFLYCKGECRLETLPFRTGAGTVTAAGKADIVRTGGDKVESLFGDELYVPLTPALDAAAPAAEGNLQVGYQVVPQYGARNHKSGDPAQVRFVLDQTSSPGLAIVAVTLELAHDFHVYALTKAPGQRFDPTTLEVKKSVGLRPVSETFTPTTAPVIHEADLGTEVVQSLNHDGSVTWTRVYEIEPGTAPGLEGSLRFQICKGEDFCLQPVTIPFSLGSLHDAADVTNATAVASTLSADVLRTSLASIGRTVESPATDAPAAPPAAPGGSAIDAVEYENADAGNSLLQWLVYSFLGGLILNVMPCVLPVISIKVLSFVHQAGEQPGRILLLNVVYALGVLTVFFALATLAITLQLGWGAQNQSAVYNIIMAAVVFAMGLSLLGVFEIPIPGMMSSGLGGQHGEGLTGAYLTGILATLLATPCTGPYMATVLFWSLQQPTSIVFLIWGTMGLGMASPYLLIGCFPKLVDWLPRPGQWMVTFKQACGFILMLTTVWMLNTIQGINALLVTPTLLILVGIAVMVWMVGNLYDLSSTQSRRWLIRGLSLLLAGPIVALGVNWAHEATEIAKAAQAAVPGAKVIAHGENALPWQPFSNALMDELIRSGKPVLMDFTADYCAICKYNERIALNTEETKAFVEEHGVVPVVADFTTGSEEIQSWLKRFDQDAVPLYVFIPGGQPKKIQVLRGKLTQSQVSAMLQQTIENSTAPVQNAGAAAGSPERTASL